MKKVNTLGLVFVTAVAILAVVGPPSAMASGTVLCKASESTGCVPSQQYPSGTTLKATASSVKILGKLFGDIECTGSTIEGKTTAQAAEPLPGEILAWSLGSCSHFGETCTAATEHLPGSTSLSPSTTNNGNMVVKGTGGPPGWHVVCPGVNCTLTFEPTVKVQGGSPATLSDEQSMTTSGGGFCPSTATFSGSYTVNTPSGGVYVEPAQPSSITLCKAHLSNFCRVGDIWPAHTVLKGPAESWQLLLGIQGEVVCTAGSITAETTAAEATPLPALVTGISTSGCHRNPVNEPCTVKWEGLPYSAEFNYSSELLKNEFNAHSLKFHMACGEGNNLWINCTYRSSTTGFTMSSTSPPTISMQQEVAHEGWCPEYSNLKSSYKLSEGATPVYLTPNA